jgi:hypothetical protein
MMRIVVTLNRESVFMVTHEISPPFIVIIGGGVACIAWRASNWIKIWPSGCYSLIPMAVFTGKGRCWGKTRRILRKGKEWTDGPYHVRVVALDAVFGAQKVYTNVMPTI